MLSAFKKYVFFAKNFIFRRSALRFFENIQRESRLSDEERRSIAFKRMKSVLRIAYEKTDFYRKKFDSHGVSPSDLKKLDDIKKFPTLTKDEIRDNFLEMQVKGFKEGLKLESSTGGSTGVPLKVIHDKTNYLDVLGWFVLKEWGLEISDNACFLERYNPHASSQFFRTMLNKMLWWPTRRGFIAITEMTNEGMEEYFNQCLQIRPLYLEGYVGAVLQFAEFLIERDIRLPSVRLVWTTSAPLSLSARSIIERAFKSPVVDQYGCCEIYWLGYECLDQRGLHIFDTIRHYEILNLGESKDPMHGELVITDLLNSAFPLIRYEIKDRSSFISAKSENGTCFPLIEPVQGRESDAIRFPEGGGVPGEFLTTIFDSIPESVKQFQVVQKKDYSIQILVVPSSLYDSTEKISKVVHKLNHQWPAVKVETKWVKEIPHDNGKIRYVKCLLD